MNIKNELDKSIEELLEELDIAIDDDFNDDPFYNDGFLSEESELINDLLY